MMSPIQITMLNAMAGVDIREACDRMRKWGIQLLDLKDCIFGKAVENLTPDEAHAMAALAESHGMRVHTLSTCIFGGDIEEGEAQFRERYAPALQNIVSVARILRPTLIRLLAAQISRRSEFAHSPEYLGSRHPWVISFYQSAVDQIAEAGFRATIENEVHRCIFSRPAEILDFFRMLDRPRDSVCFTWDIQNLWQMGTFPTLEVYRQLKPIIGMIHLKGGKAEYAEGPLKWQANLEDASWPVLEILRAIAADGVSPVICLNPSHGSPNAAYANDVRRDLAFLESHFPGTHKLTRS